MRTDIRYIFILIHGMNVMVMGMVPPIVKLRPEIMMRYCICVSHCRSTMILSDASVSSSSGVVTTVMSCKAVSLVVKAPGRCTTAFSFHKTEP